MGRLPDQGTYVQPYISEIPKASPLLSALNRQPASQILEQAHLIPNTNPGKVPTKGARIRTGPRGYIWLLAVGYALSERGLGVRTRSQPSPYRFRESWTDFTAISHLETLVVALDMVSGLMRFDFALLVEVPLPLVHTFLPHNVDHDLKCPTLVRRTTLVSLSVGCWDETA